MMFAVIRTGGKQYRVQKGDILQVERLNTKQGQTVVFDEVLLLQDGKKILIGTPLVDKAQVKAEVIENFKDDKVIIFKKKRRKQYQKKAGHRQELTRIKIEDIVSSAKAPARKPKPEEKERKVAKKPEAKKKPAAKKEAKPKPKKSEAAKPTPKKKTAAAASKPKKVTKTKEK